MPRGKPIGPTDADQALRLVAEGRTLSEIATTIGVSYSGLHRALTETWPDEYAEAKQRRNDVIRNRVHELAMQNSDMPTARWALDHEIRWHLPEAKETHTVDVNVQGQVQIAHEARLTLAHVAALADRLGASPRRELPAAPDVLSEPSDG